MRKLLAVLLAIICLMNLTVVSFAVEAEVSYFDEETGALYLVTENWADEVDFGEVETEEEALECYAKVKTVYFDEDCDIAESLYICIYFNNLEKIVVVEDSSEWFVYDNALYNYSEGTCTFAYYPPKCADKDIVMHPDATRFGELTVVSGPDIGGISYDENTYNLYIVGDGQFSKLREEGMETILLSQKYDKVYVNATQESIDAINEYPGYSLDVLNKILVCSCFSAYYDYRYNSEKYREYSDALTKIYEEVLPPQDHEDLAARNEYYDTIYTKRMEYIETHKYTEFTEEEYALTGNQGMDYDMAKKAVDYYYHTYLYLSDRGNPIKPLSTLTSGACGEGVEWTIDRENGVLSIAGNGAIADNYTGFDVFKDVVATVEIGSCITAIGENVFTGFTVLAETKFDGTQAQWDSVAVADGNEDLIKNVTVNPYPPVEPEEDPTFWDKVVEFFDEIAAFFVRVFNWFANIFAI